MLLRHRTRNAWDAAAQRGLAQGGQDCSDCGILQVYICSVSYSGTLSSLLLLIFIPRLCYECVIVSMPSQPTVTARGPRDWRRGACRVVPVRSLS